jgi:hypothetical protein
MNNRGVQTKTFIRRKILNVRHEGILPDPRETVVEIGSGVQVHPLTAIMVPRGEKKNGELFRGLFSVDSQLQTF